LISALKKDPAALLEKMHIQSDAVLVNQCDKSGDEEMDFNGHTVRIISMTERGIGLSRNTCLENATADILLFADDDIVYDAGYEKALEDAFDANPDADILLFNVRVCEERKTYWNEGVKKISRMNCGRYPAYSIAIKGSALKNAGVKFSLLFGGGAKYSNGEDSLFLTDCIRKGLMVYTTPVVLGEEISEGSTWFHGFTEKFFFDRGVLFAFLYPHSARLWAFRFVYLKGDIKSDEIGKKKAWKQIRDGIREGKRLRK
jgi:glycosyltransferase involved in cell wall biosynthesis